MTRKLSIAIVNWNTRDMLLDALKSIFDTPPSFDIEVIVVDNHSKDASAEAVAQQYPQVILVANDYNAGYAQGNNQAIECSTGEFVLLLNPDVVLPPDGLQKAVEFMGTHTDAGALGVKQVHLDGSLQRSVRGFPTPAAVMWELLGLSRLLPKSRLFGAYRMTWFEYDRTTEVDQPMGTFLMMRRTVIDEIGRLDLQFPIFFNEVDWCLRCKRAGWKIYFTPEVEILHYGGAGTSQVGAAMAWESRRGLLTFYKKHYGGLRYLPLRWIIAGASFPHAWLQSRKRKQTQS